MNAAVAYVVPESGNAARYARCLAASKKAEWEIDKDLMRAAPSTSHAGFCRTDCR